MRSRARQQRGRAEERARSASDAASAALRMPSFASSSSRAVEGERRDQQRDGEADAGDRAAAGDGRPADRRAQPAAAQPRDEPRRADDARPACRRRSRTRIPSVIGERERARRGSRRRSRCRRSRARTAARSRSSSTGGRAAAAARSARSPTASPARAERASSGVGCSRNSAEQLGRALEVDARGRVRVGEQAHRQADDDRVDAGLEQRRPTRAAPSSDVDEPDAHAAAPRDEHDRAEARRPRRAAASTATCSL